jgi:hypothetical protein
LLHKTGCSTCAQGFRHCSSLAVDVGGAVRHPSRTIQRGRPREKPGVCHFAVATRCRRYYWSWQVGLRPLPSILQSRSARLGSPLRMSARLIRRPGMAQRKAASKP